MSKEGWSGWPNTTEDPHYYRNGWSLCGTSSANGFGNFQTYSILRCSDCERLLNKELGKTKR